MRKIILGILIFATLLILYGCGDQGTQIPDPTDVIVEATKLEKVQAKMENMTLLEKVSQMVAS